jgi:P27 family predicted phage terminase small subunit
MVASARASSGMTRAKKHPAQRGRKSAASLAIVRPAEPKPAPPARNVPAQPAHLSDDAAAWWREVVRDFALEPHHLKLLQAACESWDRAQLARRAVAEAGLTFTDSSGNLKANPAVAIERDARTLFARLVRELNLDGDAPHAD